MARRWLERVLDTTIPLKVYAMQAENFETCLVAEAMTDYPSVVLKLFPSIADQKPGIPADGKLRELGYDFYDAVYSGQRRAALTVYDQIQARVRALIKAQARKAKATK